MRLLPFLAALWLLAAPTAQAKSAPAPADTMWHDPHALLPEKLADWLITQGYRIPQASYDEQTVIAGEFIQPGQRDLVVLAERSDSLHLLCFPGGRDEGCQTVFARSHADTAFGFFGKSNWINSMSINPPEGNAVPFRYFFALRHFNRRILEDVFAREGKPLPEHPTHQAIALYAYDKPNPRFFMFLDGRWQKFWFIIG